MVSCTKLVSLQEKLRKLQEKVRSMELATLRTLLCLCPGD